VSPVHAAVAGKPNQVDPRIDGADIPEQVPCLVLGEILVLVDLGRRSSALCLRQLHQVARDLADNGFLSRHNIA